MSNLQSKIAATVPNMGGWCSVQKANDLALAVIKLKADVTVEIGVLDGRSLIPMAMAHAEQQHGIVWAIDPWSVAASVEHQNAANSEWWGKLDHEASHQRFLGHIATHGLGNYVKVIRQKSDDVEPPECVDLLHIDGSHSVQAIRDVERFASRVRVGGYVFADDIHWEGGMVEKAVDKLLTMGFVKIFDRDTGAMFQRVPAKVAPKRRGRPPGKKVKKGSVKVVEA